MTDQPKSESGFQYSLGNLKPVTPPPKSPSPSPMAPSASSTKSITGLDIAKGISPSLAKRTVAMALDGVRRRSQRSDRSRCQDRVRQPRRSPRARADPPRLRARAGRSRAGAVAGHAGHHRPGDRERLLLRLLPQRAVHAGRLCRDREEDARDHRARQTLHERGVGPRKDQAGVPRQGRGLQGRAGRRHSRHRADQDLLPGRLVRSAAAART